MAPSPQPKLRQGSAAAACPGAGGLGGLQPFGAEYSSHSRSQHSQPPLAQTTSGGSNSNHRVRKFVIGGGAFAAAQQQCPVTPVSAVTPLSVPAPGTVEVPVPLTNEAEKENADFPTSSDYSSSNAGAPVSVSAGKAQRKRSERINVRLLPLDAATETRIRRAGYNPKLELSTPVRIAGIFVCVLVLEIEAVDAPRTHASHHTPPTLIHTADQEGRLLPRPPRR